MRTLTNSAITCCLVLLAACSSDKDSSSSKNDTHPNGSGSSEQSGTPGSPSGPGTPNANGDPASGEESGEPAVQFIGRFDASQSETAWPGGRIVARFSGTSANAIVSQVPGSGAGYSWLNVIVDGQPTKKVEVMGTSQQIALASDLPAGIHVVEIEKRTEPNAGSIAFERFEFPNGGTLLAPPARKTRRIEFLSDSTIDGFGIEGNLTTTCNNGTTGAPVSLDNVRMSTSFTTASLLDAEPHVIAYSGKGVVRNEAGVTGEAFPALYVRTLPDVANSTWDFSSWTPDAVVISLGGTDLGPGNLPDGFQNAYDALVTSIRGRHPNAHIYMTVWSQIKDLGDGQNLRTLLRSALDGIKAAHPSDTKLHVFAWKEADYVRDETGCAYHANEEHGLETGQELAPVIANDLGWK